MDWFSTLIILWFAYENWEYFKEIEKLKDQKFYDRLEIDTLKLRNDNQYLRLEALTRYLSCPYDHNQGFMNPNFRCGKCGFTASEFHPSILTEEVLKNTKCKTNAEGGTNESERTGEEGSSN